MAFTVEQKIKGRIYLYEVESYWDKDKKKTRQKRKYLGPKEPIYKKNKPVKIQQVNKSKFISKSYGDIQAVKAIQKKLKLDSLLKEHFEKDYKDILSLSAYLFQEASPSYLYPFWHEDHYLPKQKRMYSTDISKLYERIGKNEASRMNFMKSWCNHVDPKSGIYYDITSISSYGTNNEHLEWGYNRDKECLKQLNIGYTCCQQSSLPLSYRVHPGSIVDVSTLKNTIKLLHAFNMKNMFFILDRGFCSLSNIMEMYRNNMRFIQPLSFSIKKAKDLVEKNKQNLLQPENIFDYNGEILYYLKDEIEIDKTKFDAHLYYNEKLSVHYKNNLYRTLLELEKHFEEFDTSQECKKYIEEAIPPRYKKYFAVKSNKIIRNNALINQSIIQAGSIIFVVHGNNMKKEKILEIYRGRDKIEKEINILKNQIDNKRLRAHNTDTANGRLFVKFISLIQATVFGKCIKKNKKTSHYSLAEAMFELKKIKRNTLNDHSIFLTELTKKQKLILKALDIDIDFLTNVPDD